MQEQQDQSMFEITFSDELCLLWAGSVTLYWSIASTYPGQSPVWLVAYIFFEYMIYQLSGLQFDVASHSLSQETVQH